MYSVQNNEWLNIMEQRLKKFSEFINENLNTEESFREDFKPTEPYKFFEHYRLLFYMNFYNNEFFLRWFKPETKGNKPDYEIEHIKFDKYIINEINNSPIFTKIVKTFLNNNTDPNIKGTSNYDILLSSKGSIAFEFEYSSIDTRIDSYQKFDKIDNNIRKEINGSRELFKEILEQMQNKIMNG